MPTDDVTGLRVRTIQVRAGDLFDRQLPTEDRLVHGAANALHIATRQSTILQALPFKVGDTLYKDALNEAERLLRSRRYLRAATVLPLQRCGNAIDIEVRTVDNWTLTPSVSISSAGGVERYKIEVQDLNVLGLGKELTFKQAESAGERESLFVFGDDNVFGTHHRVRVELGTSNDGDTFALEAGLPFVSSTTPQSWWLSAREQRDSFEQGLIRYPFSNEASNEVASVNVGNDDKAILDQTRLDLGIAKRMEHCSAPVARLGIGVRYEKQVTQDQFDSLLNDPSDFSEQYPYVYAQWAKSDWSEQQNFLGLGKVEDIDTGLGVKVEAGLILDALGNETNAVRLATTVSKGFWTSPSSVHRLSLNQTQYFGRDTDERFQLGARYHYFKWITGKDHLDLHLVADQQRGQSAGSDFELGGEFGLKGYRNGYQRGDTRLLGVAEYRHVTQWSPMSLVNVAWGVFGEAGRAWDAQSGTSNDTLVDVGAGLLFSPSRGTRSEIIRLDITFPLTDGEDVDQFLLFAGTQLKFQ